MDLTRYLEQLMPARTEIAYDRLVGYRFAQRYVGGKVVADIGWREISHGSYLLADTAETVAVLTDSAEAVDLASITYPAPNVDKKTQLSELPYPEDHFDVVVAFGVVENLEQPEVLAGEARRILKQDGVLVISAPDKRAHADDRRGMYVPEFRELLEQYFERVHIYRQGAVAGGFVFPTSGELSGVLVESASLSLANPDFGAEPPTIRSVIAVCGSTQVLNKQEEPLLVLDRDRCVLDECEDCPENVELLREEIRRMQETEVQAFQDSLKLHRTEIAYLRAQVRRARAQEQAMRIQVREMENSTTWRVFNPYRRLRARIDALTKSTPESTEGSNDSRAG
jgi:SAM-dependent methyltransferase